jgi:hypothetical protein
MFTFFLPAPGIAASDLVVVDSEALDTSLFVFLYSVAGRLVVSR